jgi:hypothetical protein
VPAIEENNQNWRGNNSMIYEIVQETTSFFLSNVKPYNYFGNIVTSLRRQKILNMKPYLKNISAWI